MKFKQVIESPYPELSDDSVIFVANHRFKDDVASSVAVSRHAYILVGSLPIFFNTFDGFSLWLNGAILCNRKIKMCRNRAYHGTERVLELGGDILIFPEGVWNNSPEKLLLDFWPGAVRLAQQKGCKIVPIVHYLADPIKKSPENVIHTILGKPVSVIGLTENEGIDLIRDTMATYYFQLMEKYGQTTRAELLNGYETAEEAWWDYLNIHIGEMKYFDLEAETRAAYRIQNTINSEEVWKKVAEIANINAYNIKQVLYARECVEKEKRRDFQRLRYFHV